MSYCSHHFHHRNCQRHRKSGSELCNDDYHIGIDAMYRNWSLSKPLPLRPMHHHNRQCLWWRRENNWLFCFDNENRRHLNLANWLTITEIWHRNTKMVGTLESWFWAITSSRESWWTICFITHILTISVSIATEVSSNTVTWCALECAVLTLVILTTHFIAGRMRKIEPINWNHFKKTKNISKILNGFSTYLESPQSIEAKWWK